MAVYIHSDAVGAATPASENVGDSGDLGKVVYQVDKLVGSADAKADQLEAHPFILHRPDQPGKVAVPADQHRYVQVLGQQHHIHGDFDVQVRFNPPGIV